MIRAFRELIASPLLLFALVIVILYLIVGIFADAFLIKDPLEQNLLIRLKPPGFVDDSGTRYLMGTDRFGRDIFGLIIAGAQLSLVVALGSVSIAIVIGSLAGLIAGYKEGIISSLLMRLADLQLSFPFFLLAIVIVGTIGPSFILVLFIIAIGSWVPYARIVRSEVLDLKTKDFIESSRAIGASDFHIITRHILPNNMPSIIVLASFNLATAIILESGLSFVGLGVPSDIPSWGYMLAEGRDYVASAWWLTFFPGLSIFLIVLSINLLGDFVREQVDPILRQT